MPGWGRLTRRGGRCIVGVLFDEWRGEHLRNGGCVHEEDCAAEGGGGKTRSA